MTLPSQLSFGFRFLSFSQLVEEAGRLDDLQRIERRRGDGGDQFVRIERDARDQDFELVGAQRLGLPRPRWPAAPRWPRLGLS